MSRAGKPTRLQSRSLPSRNLIEPPYLTHIPCRYATNTEEELVDGVAPQCHID